MKEKDVKKDLYLSLQNRLRGNLLISCYLLDIHVHNDVYELDFHFPADVDKLILLDFNSIRDAVSNSLAALVWSTLYDVQKMSCEFTRKFHLIFRFKIVKVDFSDELPF